jgi:hemolysin III
MKWDYDKREILADGIVHGLGLVCGLVSVVVLFVAAARTVGPWELTSVLIYGGGLLTVLTVSALYNLWPVSPIKWKLRRFDHSAIYLLIAGTYTPFVTQMKAGLESTILLVSIWAMSVTGIALKLCFPDRYDRLSIVLYLLAGWSGVVAFESLFGTLPSSTFWLLAAGGIFYTTGVVFHVWERLRFQNAIWHAFVLIAAACHYGAVLDCMVLARA